jgi:hypothetical protein
VCGLQPTQSGMGLLQLGHFPLHALCCLSSVCCVFLDFSRCCGSGSGSGSKRTKMTHKNRKKWINFIFWSAGCSLLRAKGFSCSLTILYGGLGISKLQFLIKKRRKDFSAVFFSTNFCLSKPWIRIRINLKWWIRIRIRQHWVFPFFFLIEVFIQVLCL